jgi:hypothetical protein
MVQTETGPARGFGEVAGDAPHAMPNLKLMKRTENRRILIIWASGGLPSICLELP